MLAASGALAASLALLPATVVLLFAVMDAGAHAFLGLSGALVSIAGSFLPETGPGQGLPDYQRLPLAVTGVIVLSLARALAPAAMVLLATRRPTRPVRLAAIAASAGAIASAASVPLALVPSPGLLASLLLLAASRHGD